MKIRNKRRGSRNPIIIYGTTNSQLQSIALIVSILILIMVLIGSFMSINPKSDCSPYLDINIYPIIIDVDANGEIRMKGKKVSLNEITKNIELLQSGKFNKYILIRGESHSPYGIIMSILLNVRDSGHRNVSFVVRR
ncbi:ExbD/TolR family protein [Candidatus Liberibacter brunswickensis]|uniref:ExbD/TolR family protein n=1 Tax=Candidatus Liberibacter brunswickensis TaxID=1968796 RepID=UPI002FE3BCFB